MGTFRYECTCGNQCQNMLNPQYDIEDFGIVLLTFRDLTQVYVNAQYDHYGHFILYDTQFWQRHHAVERFFDTDIKVKGCSLESPIITRVWRPSCFQGTVSSISRDQIQNIETLQDVIFANATLTKRYWRMRKSES